MPFILITGIPASGKSTVATKLSEYFFNKHYEVRVICENEILKQKQLHQNDTYSDSKIEKEIRGMLRSEYFRCVSADNIVILDGLNYIKGFRYELYCGSKSYKTTQCVIHCDPGVEAARKFNKNRELQSQYSQTVFDELVFRYEAPESRNRWDSPLFLVVDNEKLPYEDISSALFDRKPPPPNQSTQCPPLSDTNFLHEVDKATLAIVKEIVAATKLNVEGEMKIDGSLEKFLMTPEKNVSMAQLQRLKRQFIVYVKSRPDLQISNVPTFFVQYLNTNL